MLIYNETSLAFIKRAREIIRGLFFDEVSKIYPISFQSRRIHYKNFHYPLSIVVFEDNSKWGYFDYRRFEIGLSKKLMYQASDLILTNVLKHELAHYLTYHFYGGDLGHGKEFHEICLSLNWGSSISKATMSHHELIKESLNHKDEEQLVLKVKKLLALSNSDNEYESQLATKKANQIILDYNLSRLTQIPPPANKNEAEEDVYLIRALEAKIKSAKLQAIADILKTFFVSPILNLGKNHVYLELIGEKKNVLIAEYVAHFLDKELDRLFLLSKKNHPTLKGKAAKNSFFRGVQIGYCQKIREMHLERSNQQSLILIKKDIEQKLAYVYPKMSSVSFSPKENGDALSLGKKAGHNLNIHHSLSENKSKSIFLLQ